MKGVLYWSAAASLASAIMPPAAFSQQQTPPAPAGGVTVTNLIADGFVVVSAFMTQIGPGLFLQKADRLFVCFVRETRDTPTLTTIYCKMVE